MIDINAETELKAELAAHALSVYPQEGCGLIVDRAGVLTFLPCRNIATDPLQHFAIAGEDYADAEDVGAVIAVFHSHPGATAQPSPADRAMCEKVEIDQWIICSLGVQADGKIGIDDWSSCAPCGYIAPLIGRQFVHGIHDCYSIIRDWYRIERDITIPDFARADDWWKDGKSSLYLDNYRAAGFIDVGRDASQEVGDVILMEIMSANMVPNHAAIYLGDGRILHHVADRLSGRALYGGTYQNWTRTILRYRGPV